MTELLVGFRDWLCDEQGRVTSLPNWSGRRTEWPPGGVVTARCESGEAPHLHCRCGVHAFYLPNGCRGDAMPLRHGSAVCVAGALVAGGHVVECRDGFRAGSARLVAVAEPQTAVGDLTRDCALRVAERHDVPVLPRPELVAYAAWFGELRKASGEVVVS